MSLLAVEGPAREIERSVDLACHDEIVLVQSFDFLGAQGDGHVTPAEADLGVTAGVLGEFTDFLNKGECFPEIAKSKGPPDAIGIVSQLPIGSLCLEALGFLMRERWDAAATACMFSRREFRSCTCLQDNLRHGRQPRAHRSISPNTISSEPMIAETSASMCPRLKKSIACRWANEGARILHL